jgi:hypothetical protein
MRAGGERVTRGAYVAVLAAGWAAMLVANLPGGHLTVDSILELYEGRFRIRQTWAPSFYAWVLGAFDGVSRGVDLYVAACGLLLVASLASFAWLRPQVSRWAVLVALLLSVSPLLLLYQAIVWKDVLFADAAVAGMTCLSWGLRDWPARRARWLWLSAALVLLAAAALLRQNGIIVGLAAAAALGWARAVSSGRRGLASQLACGLRWGMGGLAAILVVSHAMNLATQPARGPALGDGMAEGLRVLQTYDLLGAVALDPGFPLTAVGRSAPAEAATVRRLAPLYYSAERTDFTDGQPQIADAMATIPGPALAADWRDLILRRPGLYLRERGAVFGWVFLTPRIDRCVPICLGVQGPQDVLAQLGLAPRWSAQDDWLLAYNGAFTHTPVYSHLAYALLALGVGLALLRRRDPADLPIIALMASGLGFAASFFLISIACDYRYLYFLDVAAMAGLAYLAVDPVAGFGRARRSALEDRV